MCAYISKWTLFYFFSSFFSTLCTLRPAAQRASGRQLESELWFALMLNLRRRTQIVIASIKFVNNDRCQIRRQRATTSRYLVSGNTAAQHCVNIEQIPCCGVHTVRCNTSLMYFIEPISPEKM